jgi:hypothetical protein
MNVYEISSHWSRELVVARSIELAIEKYRKTLPKKIDFATQEIQLVKLLGEHI